MTRDRAHRWAWRAACVVLLCRVPSGSAESAAVPEPRRLNNFVTEYVNMATPKLGEYAFTFERDNWLFVRAVGAQAGDVRLKGLDWAIPVPEAMRYLPAGTHTLVLSGKGAESLVVRKVPEIQYCSFRYDPWVIPFGPYDWEFLQKHMLPHVNTMVGVRSVDQGRWAAPWRASGKRWIVQVLAPGLRDKEAPTASDAFAGLTDAMRKRPYLDGVLVDEYWPGLARVFEPTIDAMSKVRRDPTFAGRRIDPFASSNPKGIERLVRGTAKLGWKIAAESYNSERSTEQEARAFLRDHLVGNMKAFHRVVDDAPRHVIMAMGILSGPPESLNVHPHVNYRVFQDMEFHTLANDPAFDGLFGVQGYVAGYSEEETIRWLGRLYRHYCIEGNTERLTREPYILNHLVNPDFTKGTDGWTLASAETGRITARTVEDLGSMEARMSGVGDHCLVMKRSTKGPNVAAQEIRNLEPGKLYALRMYSTNLQKASGYLNPRFNDHNTLRIELKNVDIRRSFRHVYLSIHAKPEDKMYFNYWFRLFRPNATTAMLTISDWNAADDRRGAIDEETAFNFVEVAPYLED